MKRKLILGIFLFLLTSLSANAEEKYIIKLNDSVSLFSSDNVTCKYITVDKDELSDYLEAGVVEFYEPDFTVELFETYESDKEYTPLWNHEMIKISKARNIGCFGNDVKIAVIDSGVNAHEDLQNNLLPGYNFINNNTTINDDIGHGTFVSGIIAAESNGKYIDGVASCAKIVPLQCFSSRKPSPSASLIGNAIRSAVDNFGCRVINMSFGGGKGWTSQTLTDAINYALSKNCIIVAAVGNSTSNTARKTLNYPAAYDGVIGVGAVDSDSVVSYFSHYNASVDVVAPGQGITSVTSYSPPDGTSFSTPQVTALAAIAINIDENITPEKFTEILASTSTDLGAAGRDDYYGYGLVNAEAMVDKLLENTEIFISPISESNGKITTTVYNNSNKELNASGIFAEYESDSLINTEINPVSIQAYGTENLTFPFNGKVKFMLWTNTDKIKPLTLYRTK